MKNSIIFIIISLFIQISIIQSYPFWPQVQYIVEHDNSIQWQVSSFSDVDFKFTLNGQEQQQVPSYITDLLEFYSQKIFSQQSKIQNEKIEIIKSSFFQKKENEQNAKYQLTFDFLNWDLEPAYDVEKEHYFFDFTKDNNWLIQSQSYFGYVRGLETFSQLFNKQETSNYFTVQGGLEINDQPEYIHRGILLDPSKNYISVETLKNFINSMMYNKLNILHMNFSGNASCPLYLESYPDICLNTIYEPENLYLADDISELITFALTRGVRIIPGLDSPTQTNSWSGQESIKDINIKCSEPIDSQLDISMQETYDVVENLLTDIDNLFIDKFTHLGGSKASDLCYDLRPSIKEFMTKEGLQNYTELQSYYRENQQKFWNQLNPQKDGQIYWCTENNKNIITNEEQVIQWIGTKDTVSSVFDLKNPLIISYSDVHRLDYGFGTITGEVQSDPLYSTWLDIYQQTNLEDLESSKNNILGAEALLWGELVTEQTIMTKAWIRASSLAEKTWNTHANINQVNDVELVARLQAQVVRMQTRGVPTSPLTTEYCTSNPEICFYNH